MKRSVNLPMAVSGVLAITLACGAAWAQLQSPPQPAPSHAATGAQAVSQTSPQGSATSSLGTTGAANSPGIPAPGAIDAALVARPPAPVNPQPLVLESRGPARSNLARETSSPTVSREESRALGGVGSAASLAGASRSSAARSDSGDGATPRTTGSSISQMLMTLGGVVAIATIAIMLFKSWARRRGGIASSLGAGGKAPSGVLEVLGRYPIGGGVSLVLLRLDRRLLLLSQTQRLLGRGASPGGFRTLCEITDPEEVASILVKTQDEAGESMTQRFNGLLQRFDKTMDASEAEPARPVPRDRGADLVESMRGRIPVVDITQRAEARERADWHGQVNAIRQRLAKPVSGKARA